MSEPKNSSSKDSAALESEPIWVLCATPVTPLLTDRSEKRQSAAGAMPAYLGLRFERGVNILAGRVTLGGKPTFVTLADLPFEIRSKPEAEVTVELGKLFEQVRRQYPHLFGANRSFVAVGSLKDILAKHYTALRTAAERGTHRQSLEALVDHQDVPEDIKDLARRRLSAWRPAA